MEAEIKIIAGPCALLPDADRMIKLAKNLKEAGADVFRGATHKGGTFPPKDGKVWGTGDYKLLARIKDETGMEVSNEIATLPQMYAQWWAGYIWIRARSFQDYALVREVAKICAVGTPNWEAGPAVLGQPPTGQTLMLKRGPGATPRDCFGMIEHCASVGYPIDRLWIVERGVAALGTDDISRWRIDFTIIPQIKEKYPMVKVCVDVTHGCGRREWVEPLSKASISAGADGLMLEVLDVPDESPSDARETIDLETFKRIADYAKGAK